MTTQKEWTIKDCERHFWAFDILMCQNVYETINAKALHGVEIRRLADYWQSNGKLTPGDIAIAQKYGWEG